MLKTEELKNIYGGGFNLSLGVFIGGLITFFVGIVDGFVRPYACR